MRSTCSRPFSNRASLRRALLVLGSALSVMLLTGESKQPVASDAARAHIVVIESMKFSPASVHVKGGEAVRFENHDLYPHSATGKDPKRMDSGVIKPGASWTFTPATTGTLHYHCTFHPTMEAEIVVE